jgi:5-methylcytosine-specific restriction endonuclease McrA
VGQRQVSELRQRVEIRAGGRCEYCRAPQAACGYRFHLEHIVPTVQGGSDDIENRALACAACNLAKGDRTTGVDPETAQRVALFDPRNDAWEQHFRWQDDPPVITGVTPEGRATVVTLDLNGELRLAARRLWFDAGLLL